MKISDIRADDAAGPGYAQIELDGGSTQSIDLAFFDVDRHEYLWPSSRKAVVWSKQPHFFAAVLTSKDPAIFRIGPEVCNHLQTDSLVQITSRDGNLDSEEIVWPGVPVLDSEWPESSPDINVLPETAIELDIGMAVISKQLTRPEPDKSKTPRPATTQDRLSKSSAAEIVPTPPRSARDEDLRWPMLALFAASIVVAAFIVIYIREEAAAPKAEMSQRPSLAHDADASQQPPPPAKEVAPPPKLAEQSKRLSIAPRLYFEALKGEPFSPAERQFTFNYDQVGGSWSSTPTDLDRAVRITPVAGDLNPGDSVTISITPNDLAKQLEPGEDVEPVRIVGSAGSIIVPVQFVVAHNPNIVIDGEGPLRGLRIAERSFDLETFPPTKSWQVVVVGFTNDKGSSESGFMIGDAILKVNGTLIGTIDDLQAPSRQPGPTWEVTVIRSGGQDVTVKIGKS